MKSALTLAMLCAALIAFAAEDRDGKVRRDLQEVQSLGGWIYNDLDQGLALARQSGQPLLVVFRCIP
jgi:serine protease Do